MESMHSAPVLCVCPPNDPWALIWSLHTPNRPDCRQRHFQMLLLETLNIRSGSLADTPPGRPKVAGATTCRVRRTGGGECGCLRGLARRGGGAGAGQLRSESGGAGIPAAARGPLCSGGKGTPRHPFQALVPWISGSAAYGWPRMCYCCVAPGRPRTPYIFLPGAAEA